MSPSKKCSVCGDKALGYNFNAVTCESCKAFFRRNALAKKQFTCPFNQACEITVITRRFCQRCRLKKCLEIGMKSENIMSEEDKIIKRRKIETNREKRRLNDDSKIDEEGVEQETEKSPIATTTIALSPDASTVDGVHHQSYRPTEQADSSGFDASFDSQHSFGSFDSGTGHASSGGGGGGVSGQKSNRSADEVFAHNIQPDKMTGEEMVEFIVCDPDRACQAISKLMRTPSEAMASLEKILSSQKDALRLIEHLIAYPGDALKIISKIMNSPFNALSVFTKFMSSPTDALEIISKIVSSPQDVLQFIHNLMDSPEDAIDIMNKFMNTPAEALRIINKIFNASSSAATSSSPQSKQPFNSTMLNEDAHGTEAVQEIFNEAPPPPPPPPFADHSLAGMLNSSNNSPSKSPNVLYLSSVESQQAETTTSNISSPISFPLNDLSPSKSMPQSLTTRQTHNTIIDAVKLPPTTSIAGSHAWSSSSSVLIPNNDINVDLTGEQFDMKSVAFSENSLLTDSINSLDSVLSEVIRIEFQAFNELPPEPRIKQEHYCQSFGTGYTNAGHSQQQKMAHASPMPYYACHNHHHNQQKEQQQQPQSELQQPICAPSTSISSVSRDLNDMEQMKLRELKLASEALYYPVDDDLTTLMVGDNRIKPEDTNQDPKLLQVINLTAVAIKRLIKMAKKISVFREMCQEDQVALLKGGCTEMMIMRSVMSYDGSRNTWKIPHTKEDMSNIRAEILKLAKGNVYEEHLKFIRTFDEKWRMDENIILIMCAIVLFMPTRLRVIHSDVIRLEQNSYYYLLRRYLESVYAGCEARSAFIKLIQKISDVERLNHCIIGVYLNVNPAQVEPLLREIFDLKNH